MRGGMGQGQSVRRQQAKVRGELSSPQGGHMARDDALVRHAAELLARHHVKSTSSKYWRCVTGYFHVLAVNMLLRMAVKGGGHRYAQPESVATGA
jgi:hypothetical protein